MIDFHCHVLPRMDDGSKSTEESLAMLRRSAEQGVTTVAATPHYYAERETVSDFLARREAAASALREAMAGCDELPALRLGAETAWFPGISTAPDVERLCLEGTRVLLLEMPFSPWTKRIFKELEGLTAVRGLTVMIAHIERYAGAGNDWKAVRELLDCDVLIQANAEFFLGTWSRVRALRMLRAGEIQLLGSDSHNLTSRPPNLGQAARVIERKCGKELLLEMERFSERLLKQKITV